ncbi:protein shortage in chiasmata 1 ortholog isoform X2 [Dunckerocampus dactyliophorus]|uniref:protein shortage in chiasmata 1 ortholog isoform X2 n=1 Tax=Dunckerocampus dactyliophorus TaxID=161453 RepID=UPI0024064D22|nr:protein shortage in chiasmata 1 ortholog isoform X2 [Dunckerocampus dactyliophorus]
MSTVMFSSLRYKALDYIFEASSRLKVMTDLLALPTPYTADSHELYPHSGTLADVTYRKPWVRGNMNSTCSSSVLDDLKGTTQEINSPERFHGSGSGQDVMEVLVSSVPDSAELPDQGEQLCPLKASKLNEPCHESFYKLTSEQMDPENKNESLLLPEEMMVVDFLPHFKQHLPTLKSKLSRLRTLKVADPLLSLTGNAITEETILRHCVAYERPSDVMHGCPPLCANVNEGFCKESLTKEESLLLPELLDAAKTTIEYPSSFSSICRHVNVVAEQLDGQLSVMEVLSKDNSTAVEMFPFSLPALSNEGDWLKDTDAPGRAMLPTEMELDVTLTPPPASAGQSHVSLRTSDLQREALSPPGRLSLVSAGAQQQMETVLWKSEKHPNYVLNFLFPEPEIREAAVDFQPLSEALKLQALKSFAPEMETRVLFGSWMESPEALSADVPSNDKNQTLEDFSKVSLEPDEKSIISSVVVSSTLHPPHPEESETAALPLQAAKDFVQKHSGADLSQRKYLPLIPNTKEVKPKPSTSTVDRVTDKIFPQVSSVLAPKNVSQSEQRVQKVHFRVKDDQGGITAGGHPARQQVDPLTTFMMLRSRSMSPVLAAPPTHLQAPEPQDKVPQSEVQQPPPRLVDWKPTTAATSGHASRGQNNTSSVVLPTNDQRINQDGSRVLQIQATDSQYQAYHELLAFAQPRLTSARELGLNLPAWRDFERLAPDQTRYVLKQREVALCRMTQAERGEPVRDQEQLFRHVLLIHVLVTAKELLFKCDLNAAAEYLSKAVESCADLGLAELLRRLQIILHLSRVNRESNLKVLELQQLVSTRLQNGGEAQNDKILVIVWLCCEDGTCAIIQHLNQLTAVTAICPNENTGKLNGASVVSSVQDSVCVMVYEQHLGPDFPWNLFSLVVEYDHPGPSPWATICKERKVEHLTFDIVLPESASWCLEDKVAYVLLVTGTLIDWPLLLQTLESAFNVSVLERSHCPSLQMLGGTDHYAVITVDEHTAVMVQEHDEICQERASEVMVMRLTALSLQYTHCWIILHCPDSQGGGFSSQAFDNLVLVYSSLVLFGMKSDDLEVKVLLSSEVFEVAKWVNRICFLSLMSSAQDPVSYLERDWLALTCSQEEQCLSQFPSINPLVSQLMLKRAPSLPWLLGASLTQLEELLPEVPHKVLKLFSDTASQYNNTQPQHVESSQRTSPPESPWSTTADPLPPREFASRDPESFPGDPNLSFLFGSAKMSFSSQEDGADFRCDPTWPACSPDVSVWMTGGDAWNELDRTSREAILSERRGRAGAVCRVVGRGNNEWSRPALDASLDSPLSWSGAFSRANGRLSPPSEVQLWHHGVHGSHVGGRVSHYGSRCWMGQERKRSEEAAGLSGTVPMPLKRGRLCYEKVPGRTDGQTRLKLF